MKTLLKVFFIVLIFTSSICSAQFASNENDSKLPIDPKTKCYVRYDYFPNLEAYFDNYKLVYYFKLNGEWKIAEELPTNYGGYSLYNKVRVAINDYDGEEPYSLIKFHKKMYPYNSKGRFTNQTASAD